MGIRFPGPETIHCLVPFPDQMQHTVEGVREMVPVGQPVNAQCIDISLLHQPQILTTCAKLAEMSAPRGSTPIVYHDDAKMQNGGNGGDGSSQIVPQVVQPD